MPTVLISGANRGIGLELARQYKKDGWRVIGTAREPAKSTELKALGAEIHGLDVTDHAAVERLGRELAKESIDVLIANAGVSGQRDMTPETLDEAQWLETFRVNAIAPLALAGAFHAQVARSSQKKIIGISSILGSIASNTTGGMYGYRSSKAALNAAWRSLAADWKEVIAVVLHPGWVRTDMGGDGADIAAEESVTGLRRVIAGLKQADSGAFFSYDGAKLPW
jgi:NAD(P)-dependent dehydrogenase (short-subunit alcohol dehydrogenase family)